MLESGKNLILEIEVDGASQIKRKFPDTVVVVCENRVEAIGYAIDHAQSGDVIVLAGKGHETYQIIGTEKHHLDEREVVAEHLRARR